jgi:MoaA/NifB/PqqE/SkfB family radical SAM enzyme
VRRRSATEILARQAPGLLVELARVARAARRREPTLPWKLEFFTTYSCGSRCKTCLIWTRYEREPGRRADELGALAFARVARSVAPHLRWLSFTGGEITDRDDAEALVAAVADAAPRARVLSVSSHGLDPERVERLFRAVASHYPDRAVMVTLSLDGLGATYARVRGVDGAGRVLESMDRLQRAARDLPNLAPSFQTTLSSRNLAEASGLLAALAALAAGNVVTVANDSRVLTEGRIKGVDVRRDPRLRAALDGAIAAVPLDGLAGLFGQVYLRLLRGSLDDEAAPLPCSAGLASLTISPYGEVLQCDRHDAPLGRLEGPDWDLARLVRSEAFGRRLAPWIGCTECFTPCQAYPSMMQAPVLAAWRTLRKARPPAG